MCNTFLDREAGSELKERRVEARSTSYLELSERCKILPSTSVLLCRFINMRLTALDIFYLYLSTGESMS